MMFLDKTFLEMFLDKTRLNERNAHTIGSSGDDRMSYLVQDFQKLKISRIVLRNKGAFTYYVIIRRGWGGLANDY